MKNKSKERSALDFDPSLPLTLPCKAYKSDDYTQFVSKKDLCPNLIACLRKPERKPHFLDQKRLEADVYKRKSIDLDHPLKIGGKQYHARLHAASCFSGSHFSVTLRDLKPLDGGPLEDPPGKAPAPADPSMLGERVLTPPPAEAGQDYLEPAAGICRSLYDNIFFEPGLPAVGLVLVSGATKTGKTLYLNALVNYYLADRIRDSSSSRRPHLLAIGDPVETKGFAKAANGTNVGDFQAANAVREVDFTERLLQIDVMSVEDALQDALRETPAAVVVSELRDDRDFKATLRFAATGHLVFATSHNSSLVDAMEKLMHISRATTPSTRATLVNRLKGIVHLRAMTPVDNAKALVLPSLWRATPPSIRTFVSEGLSSILHRAPGTDIDKTAGTLGYYWAAKRLEKSHLSKSDEALWRGRYKDICSEALGLDLKIR